VNGSLCLMLRGASVERVTYQNAENDRLVTAFGLLMPRKSHQSDRLLNRFLRL
jgi:hypothetical protein